MCFAGHRACGVLLGIESSAVVSAQINEYDGLVELEDDVLCEYGAASAQVFVSSLSRG